MHRLHIHKVDWHELGVHFGHLIHDPRFWAAIALGALLASMIIMAIMSKPVTNVQPTFPSYPFGYPY